MHLFRTFAIAAAPCMLVLLLHLTVLSLSAAKNDPKLPAWGYGVTQPHSVDGQERQQFPELQDFKPPKQSFVDYTTFLLPDSGLPIYDPRVVRGGTRDASRTLPDVYRDIFIPPDIVT